MPCRCVWERDVLRNVERGWRGLSRAEPIPESPLTPHVTKDLWVTATRHHFKEHLRHVAIRQGPTWGFVVVSDADLMDAWLARVEDEEVIDGDVELRRRQPITSRYGALVDMVEPPEPLIIIVGVKAARNSAMPEVLLEALHHRTHIGKSTWIVDQPDYRLARGHIAHNEHVEAWLGSWPHLDLSEKKTVDTTPHLGIQVATMEDFDAGPRPRKAPDWVQREEEKLGNGDKRKKRFNR